LKMRRAKLKDAIYRLICHPPVPMTSDTTHVIRASAS
jgi:hypothetical protein